MVLGHNGMLTGMEFADRYLLGASMLQVRDARHDSTAPSIPIAPRPPSHFWSFH